MKLSTKLILSYLAVAFLVLLVGASSYILNKYIENELIKDSQRSITEMQRLSNLEFNLQNSLLFTRNFLFEISRDREADPLEVQLKSRAAEMAARDNLDRFAENLDSIRTDRFQSDNLDQDLYTEIRLVESFADTLSESFELYRSLVNELFELEDEVGLGDEMFNLTIEPFFRTTLLQILDDFRSVQGVRIEQQMVSLRQQAERNTAIIIIITCFAFIVSCWLAYLIYHSIARPIHHLTLATEEIGSGNLDKRIRIGTNDELEQLGESFNKMAENLNKSMVSREYVNNIIQSMGDMLIVTNSEFEIELINKSITETLGYGLDDLHGRKIWTVISDQHVPYLKKNLFESSRKRSLESRYKTSGGDEIPVIISFSSLMVMNKTSNGVVFVASNITVHKEAENKINQSLREKEVLLAEIHHRVKNNLAVISGLLEMQVWNLPDDDKSISPLKESQLRIQSIALVHELLYESEILSEIKFDEYILKLLQAIQQTHSNKNQSIQISTDLEPVRLTIHKAIPTSLMLNELIVNSYKHAFSGLKKGQIRITLTEVDEYIQLIVQDDGCGLPSDFDPFNQKSLGMTLIKTLVQQIHATLQVESLDEPESGSRFTIDFEKD